MGLLGFLSQVALTDLHQLGGMSKKQTQTTRSATT